MQCRNTNDAFLHKKICLFQKEISHSCLRNINLRCNIFGTSEMLMLHASHDSQQLFRRACAVHCGNCLVFEVKLSCADTVIVPVNVVNITLYILLASIRVKCSHAWRNTGFRRYLRYRSSVSKLFGFSHTMCGITR